MPDWLTTAAQQQGFVVALLLALLGVIYRDNLKKDKTIRSQGEAFANVSTSIAIAMEKGANAQQLLAAEIQSQRREFGDLRTEVLKKRR